MSLAQQRVAIAGGGIIGLAVALELAQAGAKVTVFERDAAMQQASWAAAGMLAVEDPENDPRLLPLSRWSRSLYPAFLSRVEQLSSLTVSLRTQRTLQAESHGQGPRFCELDEKSLDPRDLCAALPRAVRAAGVTLYEHTGVKHVSGTGDTLSITVTPPGAAAQTHHADRFVLAAGAWSGTLQLPGSGALPIGPRKGQMIEVLLPNDAPGLARVMRSAEIYLVPRTERRIVIGATVEEAGFDRSLDAAAAAALLRRAAELWPPIAQATLQAHWSGLRPCVLQRGRQGLPCIGPARLGDDRLWVATGHFRNGILLAPGTASLLCAMMDGAAFPIDASPFLPSHIAGSVQREPDEEQGAGRDKRFFAAL